MKTIIIHTKLAIYARHIYFTQMSRGLFILLVTDAVVRLMLKRIERNQRRLAAQVAYSTNYISSK